MLPCYHWFGFPGSAIDVRAWVLWYLWFVSKATPMADQDSRLLTQASQGCNQPLSSACSCCVLTRKACDLLCQPGYIKRDRPVSYLHSKPWLYRVWLLCYRFCSCLWAEPPTLSVLQHALATWSRHYMACSVGDPRAWTSCTPRWTTWTMTWASWTPRSWSSCSAGPTDDHSPHLTCQPSRHLSTFSQHCPSQAAARSKRLQCSGARAGQHWC